MRKLIVSACISILGFTLLVNPVSADNVLDTRVVYDEAKIWCDKFNQDVAHIMAQVDLESSYNAEDVSHCGAQGLMQLMPGTAKWMVDKMREEGLLEKDFVYNWKNWKQNLMIGIYHMHWLQEYYRGTYPEEHLLDVSYGAYWMGTGKYESYVKKYHRYSTEDYSEVIRGRVPKYRALIHEYQRSELISRGGQEWRSTQAGQEKLSEKKESSTESHLGQSDTTSKESPTSFTAEKGLPMSTKDMDMVTGQQSMVACPVEKEESTPTGTFGFVYIVVIAIAMTMIGCAWMVMKGMKSTSNPYEKGILRGPLLRGRLRKRKVPQS